MSKWTTRRRTLTVVAAVMLTAGVAGGAWSAAVGASPGGKRLQVVVLDPAPGNDGFVDFGDVDPKGAFDPVNGVFDVSAGDTFVEDLPVADADGNGAGRAYTTVTLVRNLPPGDVLGYLHCTVRLAGGSVVFEGPITFADFADGVTFAVVGGTGRYAGFGGEAVVAPAAGGASLDFAFTKR